MATTQDTGLSKSLYLTYFAWFIKLDRLIRKKFYFYFCDQFLQTIFSDLSFPVSASEFSLSIVYGSVMMVVMIRVLLCKLSTMFV